MALAMNTSCQLVESKVGTYGGYKVSASNREDYNQVRIEDTIKNSSIGMAGSNIHQFNVLPGDSILRYANYDSLMKIKEYVLEHGKTLE